MTARLTNFLSIGLASAIFGAENDTAVAVMGVEVVIMLLGAAGGSAAHEIAASVITAKASMIDLRHILPWKGFVAERLFARRFS